MLGSLYARLLAWGSWPLLALLIVFALLCSAGFDWRTAKLEAARVERPQKATDSAQSADSRCKGEVTLDSCLRGYSEATVRTVLASIGEKGRTLYGRTELSLDLAYPFVYGLLFTILLVHLFSARQAWVLLFPLAAVTFDLLENVTVAVMTLTYNRYLPALAGPASFFTMIKGVFLLLSLLLVLFGALRGLFRRRA